MRNTVEYLVSQIGKDYSYNILEENCYPSSTGIALYAENIHCFSILYNSHNEKYHIMINLDASFGKNYYNIETSFIEIQDGILEFDIAKNYLEEFVRLTLVAIESCDLHH